MIKSYYFNRPKEKPRLILQERDLRILDLLDEFRFVDSLMIYKLIKLYYPGSYADGVKRRLRKLWINGYLERPTEQVILYLRNNQRYFVYTLAEAGADILAYKLGKDREKLKWRLKEDEYSFKFIEHALEVSKFRSVIYLGQKENDFQIRFWLGDGEFEKNVGFIIQTKAQEALFRVKQLGERVTLKVRPDGFFGIQKQEQIRFFELELDRGTRTLKDMALKMLALYKLMQGIRQEPLVLEGQNIKKFKVLILAPSELRIKHLRESVEAISERGEFLNRFLFCQIDKVNLEGPKIFEKVWQNAKGEIVSLLE